MHPGRDVEDSSRPEQSRPDPRSGCEQKAEEPKQVRDDEDLASRAFGANQLAARLRLSPPRSPLPAPAARFSLASPASGANTPARNRNIGAAHPPKKSTSQTWPSRARRAASEIDQVPLDRQTTYGHPTRAQVDRARVSRSFNHEGHEDSFVSLHSESVNLKGGLEIDVLPQRGSTPSE